VRAANKGGGDDNITVVFFEIAGATGDGQQTVLLPPVEEDEERTLSELDRVPPIATGDGRRPSAERRRRRGALFAVLGLVVLVAACGFVAWGLWRSHFVGVESDGRVAVYQGVPWNVVGNVRLYRPVYVSRLLASQLSQSERKKLFDHKLRSEDSARAAVRRYEDQIGPP
jgi:hypothetical protein